MRHFNSSSSRGRAGAPHPSAPNRTTRPAFFGEDEEDDDPKNHNTTASKFQKSAVNVGKTPDERTKEAKAEGEDEEDDYMTMTFADNTATAGAASAQPETSLQRRQRLQKEGLRRGMVPSKAELAQRERERREQGLSRSLFSSFPGGGPDDEGGVLLGPKIAAERRQKAEQEQAQQQQQQDAAARTLAMAKANKSKGLAMMAKMGFTPGSALGSNIRQQDSGGGEEAAGVLVEPLRIHVRADRGGIGLGDERKRKLREAAGLPPPGGEDDEQPPDGEDNHANKKTRIVDEGDYRERMAKERDAARKERLVLAAQKIAERMDEDKRATAAAAAQGGEEEESQKKKKKAASSASASSRPLKAIPVLYRGLVRHREQADRDRRARHDLEQSSGFADAVVQKSLPQYAEDEDDLDAYDRMAIGREEEGEEEEDFLRPGDDEKKKKKKQQPVYVPDDLDEEDGELDAFNALEVGDRLTRLVQYLRDEFRYCFWCKFAYPDEAMEGCPGITEEDHD